MVFALFFNTKIIAQYSNASLEGTWVPESENNPYIIVNSLGIVSEVGSFDASGTAGSTTVNPDGSFTITLGTINMSGQIDSSTRFHLFIGGNPSYWNKVTDFGVLKGFINGKINPAGSILAALFKIDNNGNIVNSYLNTNATLYSGKIFVANGYYAGYIKNSDTDCKSQIMLTGTLSGNTLTGKSKGYCQSYSSGTSNFTLLSSPSGSFSASSIQGSWVSPGENNPYLIFNSTGNVTEFGGFDYEFLTGNTTINSDGAINISGTNTQGNFNYFGQFQDANIFYLIMYDDEIQEFTPIIWNKVTNHAALQGTLTGNFTVGGSSFNVIFTIDNNGLITNSNLRNSTSTYTGRVLTANGYYAGLIKNGGSDKFSIIKLTGSISGNSLTGSAKDYDVNDSGGTSNFTLSALGLDDNSLKSFEIYPNPTKEYIYLKTLDKIKEVKIYSINAKLINTYKTPENPIIVSQLTSGAYILEIITIKGSKTFKFLKE